MSFTSLRLRGRLILGVVTTVVVVQSFLGVLLMRQSEARLRADLEQRGVEVLRVLSAACSAPLANREVEVLDLMLANLTDQVQEQLALRELAILDMEGRVVAHTDPQEFGKILHDPFTQMALSSDQPETADDPDLIHLSMPVFSGLRWGTVTATFTTTALKQEVRALQTKIFLSVAGLSVLLAILVSRLMTWMVIRPVVEIAGVAEALSTGKLESRVEATGRDDELERLATSFNHMASRLQSYTTELREQVHERTMALQLSNQELASAVEQLERLARTDGLTGLANHRSFKESLEKEIHRSTRTGAEVTLFMIDVDHFKNYNDTHGHPAGDMVLKGLAHILERELRKTDLIARYGGEEFVVLLLDTATESAEGVAAKLCSAVRQWPCPGASEQPLGHLSISLGIATFPAMAEEAPLLLERADAALYEAKRSGRDRFFTWHEALA